MRIHLIHIITYCRLMMTRNSGTVDKVISAAPRAHFNQEQTLVSDTESSTQGGAPSRRAASDTNIDNSVTEQPSIPLKRSHADIDEAENPVRKKLSTENSVVTSAQDVTETEDAHENLQSIAGIERMLRSAQVQMDNCLSAGAMSHFGNSPSSALSTLQRACKGKVDVLKVLLQIFKENLSQSRIREEKEASLTDLKMKLALAEASENKRQQFIRDKESFEEASLQKMVGQLKEAQREKEDTLRLCDAGIHKVKQEKTAVEAELDRERDRRIKAEDTLAAVLEIVSEMGIILGDSALKLPLKFEGNLQD